MLFKNFAFRGVVNILISAVVALLTYYALVLIAKIFGGSHGSDGYFLLASLNIFISTIATIVYTVTFLPSFIKIKTDTGIEGVRNFSSFVLTLSLLVIVPISIISLLFYENFYIFFSKYSRNQIVELRYVLIYFGPILFFSVLAEYYRTVALALGRFISVAMMALAQPLAIIIAIYLFADKIHEESLAIALLSAKCIVLFTMLTVVYKFEGLKIPFNFSINRNETRFLAVSSPYWSAGLVTSVSTFYFDYSATGLGAGILSSLSYAQRIISIPASIFVTPILEITRVKFSQYRAESKDDSFNSLYRDVLLIILVLTIPASFMLSLYAKEIVSALFASNAFSKDNVDVTVTCIRIYAISVPFSCIFMLNGRAVESFQKLFWPSLIGSVGNFIVIIATAQLVQMYDYRGIPFAKIAIDLLYFLPFGFLMLYKLSNGNRFSYFLRSSALVLASTFIGMYGSRYIMEVVVNIYQLTSYERFIAEVTFFLMIYLLVCGVLYVTIKRKVTHKPGS